MSNLPQVKPKILLKTVLKLGFYIDRKTGSHVYLKHKDGRTTSISIHPKPIPKGTFNAILKQIKVAPEEFRKLL